MRVWILLGVLTVLGIVLIIMVAVPVFLNQVGKANEAGVKSALRNAAMGQATFYVENERYTTDLDELQLPSDRSADVSILRADEYSYCIEAWALGTDSYFVSNDSTAPTTISCATASSVEAP